MLKKIIRAVKGQSEKDAFYGFLVQLLGRKPKDKELYALAFRHKSASLFVKGRKLNNERLEYLGDAVLGAVVADVVFRKFPMQKEGFLTKLRSKLVSRKQLNRLGRTLGVQTHLVYNGTFAENVLGNCVEALVGAIYLDFGYELAKQIIYKRFIHEYVDFDTILKNDENYKSKLVEWAQHEKKDIFFATEEEVKNMRPYFSAKVFISDDLMGQGEGTSKKIAQQMAAEAALFRVKGK